MPFNAPSLRKLIREDILDRVRRGVDENHSDVVTFLPLDIPKDVGDFLIFLIRPNSIRMTQQVCVGWRWRSDIEQVFQFRLDIGLGATERQLPETFRLGRGPSTTHADGHH
jgi:hypothetical protein